MSNAQKEKSSNQSAANKGNSAKAEVETSKSSVGLMLKKTRMKHNLTLQDVSNYLNIRRGQLESIEEGRFDELPATAYAVGFIKSYADYLGLDKDMMVNRFKQETGKQIQKIDLDVPLPLSESRLPDQRIIVASVAATAVFVILMFFVFSGDSETQETVTAVPNVEEVFEQDVATQASQTGATAEPSTTALAVDPNATAPVEGAVATPTTTTDAAQVVAPTAELPADGTQAPTAELPADATATTAPVTGEESASDATTTTTETTAEATTENAETDNTLLNAESRATVYGAGNVDSRIAIKARQNSWIEIRDNKNVILLSRVLKPDDVYHVPGNTKTYLTTGNAGGLDVYIDNKFAGVAGKAGEVLRQYQITAEGLIAP